MKEKRGLFPYILKINLIINSLYPLGWVLVFQFIMAILFFSESTNKLFADLYQKTLWFSSLNKAPPFSSSLGQAYAMVLVLLIPVQTASLFLISPAKISESVFINANKTGPAAIIFLGVATIVLFFFLPLSDNSLVRLFGSGVIAMPLHTTHLAL
ncbi:MAG: hypothetical protein Q8N89_11020 [Azonexus sp.]|nr:hypothetical protein [Azonexus sp.]